MFVNTGAVLSGLGTDDDNDAVCHAASHVVQCGLSCDLGPNGQKRCLGTALTNCISLFFPVLLWLTVTHTHYTYNEGQRQFTNEYP